MRQYCDYKEHGDDGSILLFIDETVNDSQVIIPSDIAKDVDFDELTTAIDYWCESIPLYAGDYYILNLVGETVELLILNKNGRVPLDEYLLEDYKIIN